MTRKKQKQAPELENEETAEPVDSLLDQEAGEESILISQTTDADGDILEFPSELSILPLRDNVLFPAIVAPLTVTREASVRLIDDAAVAARRIIGVATLKDPEVETPSSADLHPVGVVAVIRMMFKMPDHVRLIVQGLKRVRLLETIHEEPYIRCRVEVIEETDSEAEGGSVERQALFRHVVEGFQKVVQMSPHLPEELQAIPLNVTDASTLTDLVTAHMPIATGEKQELLETFDVHERLTRLSQLINREVAVLEVGNRIASEVSSEMNRVQREYYLREQLKAIQKELGEADDREAEVDDLREKIEASGMPEAARKEADRELDRLQRMPPAAAEYTVARTYLDWLVTLPWQTISEDNLVIPEVRDVLDEDHYALGKIKDRILEFLSVRKFKAEGEVRQPILCFAGPPGVGKTSLGRSIARALGRKFVRFSLGGMRDEAEIRGHRRTYIGAMPGQIIQGIRRAGTRNPVMMLDEIDKVGQDFRGDPSSALLEVLDPEQNSDFRDHYLDVPFDLSRVLFITTANMLDTILPPLRDRMEIIELPGYTEEEKIEIARRHLIPKQLEEHGLSSERLTWSDEAIQYLIGGYTREAGVRNLEREIAAITRKGTREFAEGRTDPMNIDLDRIRKYLGSPRFEFEEVKDRVSHPGVATGLFYTPVGGGILFIEAVAVPDSKGSLVLTGQLGNVMRESAQASLSFVRARRRAIGLSKDFFKTHDIHVHVPAGAVPKDGPSAGIAMAVAIMSLLSGRKSRARVAMTGEITLTGRVLPVGGIKEKMLAARRAGIRTVILPERNRKDVEEDLDEQIRESLEFHYVTELDEALDLALEAETPAEIPPGVEDGVDPSPAAPTAGEAAPARKRRAAPGTRRQRRDSSP